MRVLCGLRAVATGAAILAMSACHGNGATQLLPPNAASLGAVPQAEALANWQFRPIGPTHMLEDFPINTSGKLNAFAQDPRNPKVLYAAGGRGTGSEVYTGAGIYKTTDGGASWQPIDVGLTGLSGEISSVVNGLWLDRQRPNVLLAATEDDGIFRSTNAGASWQNVFRTTQATEFAESSGTLYAAASAGIVASKDDGATWTVQLPGTPRRHPSALGAGGKAIFAGMSDGSVYALSAGAWSNVGTLPYDPPKSTIPGMFSPQVHQIAVDPLNSRVVYANTNDGPWNQDLHASIDGGRTWNTLWKNTTQRFIWPQAIAFSAVFPHRLYIGFNGRLSYVRADGAASPTPSPAANLSVGDLRNVWTQANGKDDACWIAADQGIDYEPTCSTVLGQPYNPLRNDVVVSGSMAIGLARFFAVSPDRKTIMSSLQDYFSFVTFDGGKTWQRNQLLSEDGFNEIAPGNPRVCYAFDENNGLTVSTDGCHTYVNFSVKSRNVRSDRIMTTPMAFDPKNPKRLYIAAVSPFFNAQYESKSIGVLTTTDYGATLTKLPWPIARPGMIAFDPRDNAHIVVGGIKNGRSTISVTFDGGKTWTQSSGVVSTPFWYDATIDPANGRIVLASDADSAGNVFILRSGDGGKTFQRVANAGSGPLLQTRLHDDDATAPANFYVFSPSREIRFNPSVSKGMPYAVLTTIAGAYISTDLGKRWQRLDLQLIAHSFWGIRWSDGYLYLGSDGQGIVRSTRPLQ